MNTTRVRSKNTFRNHPLQILRNECRQRTSKNTIDSKTNYPVKYERLLWQNVRNARIIQTGHENEMGLLQDVFVFLYRFAELPEVFLEYRERFRAVRCRKEVSDENESDGRHVVVPEEHFFEFFENNEPVEPQIGNEH